MARVLKKTGEKLRQNFGKLLKKHVEKMSANRPLAMLMITSKLHQLSGDVDENKGERRNYEIMNYEHCSPLAWSEVSQ